jgi:hypothetical protein
MLLKRVILLGLITFAGLLHAQSMSDIYKSQEKERAKLEEQRDNYKKREIMRREFRKNIDAGAAVDILKCSFFSLAFGFENEVLQSANDGTFYFGPDTTGINHSNFIKSSNGIWKWGNSGDFEYDSKQKNLFMKDRTGKVDMFQCEVRRKKVTGSIL